MHRSFESTYAYVYIYTRVYNKFKKEVGIDYIYKK